MMALFLSTLSLRRATDCAGCALKKYLISIHALLAESDDSGPRKIKVDFLFLSTLSLRRATAQVCQVVSAELYFYPRSPCGERLHHHLIPNSGTLHFYPRSPCGERLHCKTPITFRHYFYPRSPCGERLYDTYAKVLRVNISIHALLAESDIITRARNSTIRISIHALLAESDFNGRACAVFRRLFLSTLSLRRATRGGHIIKTRAKNFYPRSPCGERRAYLQYLCELSLQNFYPRSPCGERRLFLLPFYTRQQFLSTLSLRRATRTGYQGRADCPHFYPRSPCGERPFDTLSGT